MSVRPLTRQTRDGHVFVRPPEVERQLAEALALPFADLRQRIGIADHEDAASLKEETLVYLLREHHRCGDDRLCDHIAGTLLHRCIPQSIKYLQALGEQEFENATAELMSEVLKRILDLEGDTGDFLQVRFGSAFKYLAISVFRQYSKRINEDSQMTIPLESLAGQGSHLDEEDRRVVPLSALHTPMVPVERRLLTNEALERIPEPQRTAFILHYYEDWPIESNETPHKSISGFFRRDPRTIRYWLAAAKEILEIWRGEES